MQSHYKLMTSVITDPGLSGLLILQYGISSNLYTVRWNSLAIKQYHISTLQSFTILRNPQPVNEMPREYLWSHLPTDEILWYYQFFGSAMHTLGSVSATGLYVQTKSRVCKLNIENLQKIYTTKQETALLKKLIKFIKLKADQLQSSLRFQ